MVNPHYHNQGLHCLPFHPCLFDSLLYDRATFLAHLSQRLIGELIV